jgi:hypothetical protein
MREQGKQVKSEKGDPDMDTLLQSKCQNVPFICLTNPLIFTVALINGSGIHLPPGLASCNKLYTA